MSTTTEMSVSVKTDVCERVEGAVMKQLGTPPNFMKSKAINVFGNHYRVNVYVVIDGDCLVKRSSIAYSYIVLADKEGKLIDSQPEIIKMFE